MTVTESQGTPVEQWHLDKKVPLAMIIALGIQTGGAIWWAAGLNGRVETLERQMQAYAPLQERVIRIETKIDAFGEVFRDLKAAIASMATAVANLAGRSVPMIEPPRRPQPSRPAPLRQID